MKCFECDGEYEKVVLTYSSTVSVPVIEVLICNKCGDECVDDTNLKKMDDVAEKLKKERQSND
jgi:hypothetical protein